MCNCKLKEQEINSSVPGQNGCYLTKDNFKYISMTAKLRILMRIPPKCVPKGPLDNESALFQLMAWRLKGDPALIHIIDAYMRHYGEMSSDKGPSHSH